MRTKFFIASLAVAMLTVAAVAVAAYAGAFTTPEPVEVAQPSAVDQPCCPPDECCPLCCTDGCWDSALSSGKTVAPKTEETCCSTAAAKASKRCCNDECSK